MDNSEEITSIDYEMPQQQQSLPIDNNSSLANDITDSLKSADQNSNSENQTPVETTDDSSQNVTVAPETSSVVAPTDNSVPPLPPLPKDDKELTQSPAAYSADYNMQNYANYNYNMYNYNNFYGYPYPQYQWDYNSQQYYQPYQNYYNYNYNSSQTGTSKPPLPPSEAVQLPVEEKPSNKANATTVDESNRYSPTTEPDDDDATKGGLSENTKSDVSITTPQITTPLTNPVPFQNVSSEQIEISQNITESTENKIQQPVVPLITQVPQSIVPGIAQIQPYNIPLVQQPSYLISPQIKTQPTEAVNELKTQQQKSPTVNGKDDTVEKVSKASTVLGKHQAKKRLMAFSMMKQKLQEQNSINDNQGSDVGEGNDVEFMPELNVFQTTTKKKVVTNKKVIKVIKAQQTIEQIEEMKKDELMQGNNAALYQHLLRSGGNEAPILQKLGIESLAEKYSAKIREQDKRLKRHHHKHRDDRRGYKYRHRSHSKSRSRSRSKSAEKPKMRALEVKSWKDFVRGGFHFDKFRRFKLDEAEEIKEKERKSRSKKKPRDSRSDGKNQNTEPIIPVEIEKGNGEQNLRYNLLDRKKEILKGFEVVTHEGDCTKDFPSYLIRYTKSKPVVKYSQNPAKATCHLQNRQQMLATLLPEVETIVHKFFSSIKPKRLKENSITNYNYVDDQLSVIMQDENIYPFKGWWPKQPFIVTQVKEDPNVEIDKDALINEFTTSKRTKKSRFNDDTSIDLRPTVPSKWDSDYDGSPGADKAMDIEVSQNFEINTSDVCAAISREENNLQDTNHQEEAMDIGEEEPKIEINVCQVVPTTSQEHAKLDTEYEKFLKIVSAEKTNEKDEVTTSSLVQKENESNLSVNLASLNDESVHDEESENDTSTKSSDESVSLNNTAQELVDRLFVKSSSSIDKKFKKRKKTSGKKAKKLKKKEIKKKKYKSSSSESSQDSESEDSDSSSDDESESTDDSSSVEEKIKKKKIKDGKKKKNKANYKKKHKGNKNKSKKLENEKDNSSILNLLEKAFNVEIKKRPIESDESKQKKKKRKHEKKEKKFIKDNDDEFEKVKECLKETFTKLVKSDKAKKNQSLSCDDSTVSEVLKYLKIDKAKLKKNKSKKSSKQKCDSDNSDDEKSIKQSRLDECLKLDSEKKKKKRKKSSGKGSIDSAERVLKKKCKKRSKTTDTSDTDEVGLKYKKSKKDPENFFGQRPNEWNVKNESSMRGVVHHSVDKNINCVSINNISIDDVEIDKKIYIKLNSSGKISSDTEKNKSKNPILSDILKEQHSKERKIIELSDMCDENVQEIDGDVLKNVEEKIQINFKIFGNEYVKEKECNFDNDKSDHCDNEVKHKNNLVPQSVSIKDNNNGQIVDKDINSVLKPTLNKSLDQNDEFVVPTNITPIVPIQEPISISYRDKVKMNLKKLSTCQNTPFIFGFSLPLNINKLHSLKKKNIKDFQEFDEKIKTSEEDESQLLKIDCRPKVVIYPQTQKKISNTTQMVVPSRIHIETNNDVLVQNFNLDDSKKSFTDDKSSVTSSNRSEYANDEEDNEQTNQSSLENYLSDINDDNQEYKNEILSNSSNLEEQLTHSIDMTGTNRSSDLGNKEKEVSLKVENIFANEETTTTFSNSADIIQPEQHQQHFECSTAGVFQQYHNESFENFSSGKKDSNSICLQQTSIDFEVTNVELINQWISDWSVLDRCVGETNNAVNYRTNNEFQMEKTSRWDKQFKNNITNKSQRVFDGEENFRLTMSDHTADELNTTNAQSDLEIFLERQNQQDAFISNYDNTNYDYYTRNWSNEYNEYGQKYVSEPQYSEMKIIGYDQLSPVDYNIYENYNPDYDYKGENYENWKSIDTSSNQLATDEMSMQAGNNLEILPSENIVTIVPDYEDETLNSDNRNKQFFELYEQYFQHYNQNPIKYSKSKPVFNNTSKVYNNILDTLPPQEDFDCRVENIAALLPLQDRAYEFILEDENTLLYMTNDNYVAYCAIEDKCMVHISLDSVYRDGIKDKVRHCFNINQNGTILEYWLNADLIPFYGLSDIEVYSDDEICSEKCNSVGEDDLDNNNDVNDNIIEGDWILVDSDGEDKDSWLKDPYILEKYGGLSDGIGQTIAEANQDYSNSSEYDTDTSDSNYDSKIETSESKKQNVTVNPFQMSIVKTEYNENIIQNICDVNTTIDNVKQTENIFENLDIKVETNDNVTLSDQLVLNPETEHVNDTLEVNEDLTSKVISENVLTEFEGKEKNKENTVESDIPLKDGIAVEDITMLNSLIKQKMLIQRLQILRRKKKSREELSNTPLAVCCNDNMESVKHPFLGLFQPPTISILSKGRSDIKTDKRVTFADGIGPADDLAISPTHDDVFCPLSPPPLKALIRETLDLKHKKYSFTKSKRIRRTTKLIMKNKKVALVNPLIKSTDSSSSIRYYIGRHSNNSNNVEMAVSNSMMSDYSLNNEHISSPGLIDFTPELSDNEY